MLGDRGRVRPGLARRRRCTYVVAARRGDAHRRGELGDARPLAAGLLAGDQPPDPQRDRPPAPDALDAVRRDRDRALLAAALVAAGGPRVPGRHLRVRRAARVHHRAPVDRRAALREPDRDRGRTSMPFNVRVRGGDAAAPGGGRRVCRRRRLGVAWSSARAARATSASGGWRSGSRSTSSTARARASRCCKRVVVPEAALRARAPPSGRVRLDPRADPGHAARRRHHADRGAAGRRGGRRRYGEGRARRSRRSGCSRCRCRCRSTRGCPTRSSSARAALRAGQGGGGGVRGRGGRHGDRARARAGRRSSRRRAGAAWRRSCWRPRSRRGSAAGAARRRGGPRENFVGRRHEVRGEQGALPGDPHGPARGDDV